MCYFYFVREKLFLGYQSRYDRETSLREHKMNHIIIKPEECKGCRLCIESCPRNCIAVGSKINKIGYLSAEFKSGNTACTACGICYFVCPEPGAITVIEEKEKQ